MIFSQGKVVKDLGDSVKTLEQGQRSIVECLESIRSGVAAGAEDSSSSASSSLLRRFDIASVVSDF